MAASPIKMYATHMCNGCTTQNAGSGASDTVLANRHLVKLGLIKSERKKTLSIIDHAATLQEIRRPKSVRIVKRGNPGAGLRGDSRNRRYSWSFVRRIILNKFTSKSCFGFYFRARFGQ
ncbi:hypothetical protein EVAR_27569_1 [Eumeta japonica]|uniref:Uncharacterized protein n=1 Tax=Eumeta variegata TaxID=151549 RepID=A0A4C1WAV1_EUMVA|nr:hypothetical protein EVAR_27569_1 [Eumeta japonica]